MIDIRIILQIVCILMKEEEDVQQRDIEDVQQKDRIKGGWEEGNYNVDGRRKGRE